MSDDARGAFTTRPLSRAPTAPSCRSLHGGQAAARMPGLTSGTLVTHEIKQKSPWKWSSWVSLSSAVHQTPCPAGLPQQAMKRGQRDRCSEPSPWAAGRGGRRGRALQRESSVDWACGNGLWLGAEVTDPGASSARGSAAPAPLPARWAPGRSAGPAAGRVGLASGWAWGNGGPVSARVSVPSPCTDLLGRAPGPGSPGRTGEGQFPPQPTQGATGAKGIAPGPWRQGLVGAVARKPEPAQPQNSPPFFLPFFLPFLLLQAPPTSASSINPFVPSKPVQAGGPLAKGQEKNCRWERSRPWSHSWAAHAMGPHTRTVGAWTLHHLSPF